MSKYTDLEKRLQAIEVEIPKWTGHVSKRIEALEKKEPKQVEPDIVYGSTVSVRDQKIKKLDDWKFSWITDKEMKDKAIRELLLRYVPSVHYTEVEEKLNKILEGERR